MIIEILREHNRWKTGDLVDVTTNFGNELIALGIAQKHEDQARRDYTPKPPEKEPEKIEVHNYFITPEPGTEPEQKAEAAQKSEAESKAKPKRKHKK